MDASRLVPDLEAIAFATGDDAARRLDRRFEIGANELLGGIDSPFTIEKAAPIDRHMKPPDSSTRRGRLFGDFAQAPAIEPHKRLELWTHENASDAVSARRLILLVQSRRSAPGSRG